MKIIAFDGDGGCSLLTDSATLRPHEPLFVPDFAKDWELEVVPVLQIERLGKWIEPEFASRYFRECGVAARLLPASGTPASALLVNFDGALARGQMFPAGEFMEGGMDIAVEHNGTDLRLRMAWEELGAEARIAETSRYMTLKTGDLVIPCSTGLRVPATINTRLNVRLNGAGAMNLKVK